VSVRTGRESTITIRERHPLLVFITLTMPKPSSSPAAHLESCGYAIKPPKLKLSPPTSDDDTARANSPPSTMTPITIHSSTGSMVPFLATESLLKPYNKIRA